MWTSPLPGNRCGGHSGACRRHDQQACRCGRIARHWSSPWGWIRERGWSPVR